MIEHRGGHIFVILFTVLVFGVTMFVNFAAMEPSLGLFVGTTGNVSDKYFTEITPADMTFLIWLAIYVYQALWLLYGLTTLCRKSSNGYLYYSPPFMPMAVYLVFIINLSLNMAWLFLWDREYMILGCIILALCAFSLYWVNGISMVALDRNGKELICQGHKKETVFVRLLLHNGVGMYATWVTIATLLNFAIVLIYDVGMSIEDASSIALGILTFELILYSVVEMLVFDRYTRYLFTPYIVAIIALVGIFAEQWDPDKRNSQFTVALLCLSGLAFILKIIHVIVRSRRNHEPILAGSGSARDNVKPTL